MEVAALTRLGLIVSRPILPIRFTLSSCCHRFHGQCFGRRFDRTVHASFLGRARHRKSHGVNVLADVPAFSVIGARASRLLRVRKDVILAVA